jgi:hypothetical protein
MNRYTILDEYMNNLSRFLIVLRDNCIIVGIDLTKNNQILYDQYIIYRYDFNRVLLVSNIVKNGWEFKKIYAQVIAHLNLSINQQQNVDEVMKYYDSMYISLRSLISG